MSKGSGTLKLKDYIAETNGADGMELEEHAMLATLGPGPQNYALRQIALCARSCETRFY